MAAFIDLSHIFEDNMPGFQLKDEAGRLIRYSARIRPFFTHAESKPTYQGQSAFEVTEITFQTSVGTYLDSPFHRYPEGRDISQLRLEEVILPGVVIDARGKEAFEAAGVDIIPAGVELAGKAVLFNFGWSRYWGTEAYQAYPFISKEVIEFLLEKKAKLVGVDTVNIDDRRDLSRPAHTRFLRQEILIVENLTHLEQLHDKTFRFFAVPIKGKGVAAMTVRAFAEVV